MNSVTALAKIVMAKPFITLAVVAIVLVRSYLVSFDADNLAIFYSSVGQGLVFVLMIKIFGLTILYEPILKQRFDGSLLLNALICSLLFMAAAYFGYQMEKDNPVLPAIGFEELVMVGSIGFIFFALVFCVALHIFRRAFPNQTKTDES